MLREISSASRPLSCKGRGLIISVPTSFQGREEYHSVLCIYFQLYKYAINYDIKLDGGGVSITVRGVICI